MNWRRRLPVLLLGCIILFSFGFIIKYLLDNNKNQQKADLLKSDSKGVRLMETDDSFYKNYYTPVIPIKYKAESYKEISLPEGEAMNPRVSPDGSLIVLVQKNNAKNSISVVDLLNNKVNKLELGFDYYNDPSWSPDNTKIVFAGFKGSASEIYSYDLGNKKIVQITQSPARRKRKC